MFLQKWQMGVAKIYSENIALLMCMLKLILFYCILGIYFPLFGQITPTKEYEPIRILTLINKDSKVSIVVKGNKGFVKKLSEPEIIINVPREQVDNIIEEFYKITNISKYNHKSGNISTSKHYYIMIYDKSRSDLIDDELNYAIPTSVLQDDHQISRWLNKLEKLTSLSKSP